MSTSSLDLGWFEAALNVADITRSRAFYETLGFELASAETRTAALHKDDCSVTLYQGYLDPDRPQLIFWQGDVQAIARDLEAKDVATYVPLRKDAEGGAGLMLIDPDGNPIHFISMNKYAGNSPSAGPDGKRIRARQYPSKPTRDDDLGWFEFSLPVKNMAASVRFYQVLGFRIAEDNDPRNVTLVSNDCRLSLYEGYLKPDRPQLIFWQGDIDRIERDLIAGDLRPEPRLTDDRGTGLMLFDPDGHPLYFVNIKDVRRVDPRDDAAEPGQPVAERSAKPS
jgi:catechol 2,3-dioxygenase-like lactoylglutathione lyase family enzyme